jgi:predicted tellurium resistance membrane protein TerC
MIYHAPFPLKKIGLRFLLTCCCLITFYIIFIALISIKMGINHLHQDGFWMPMLAGTISIITILWLFLILIKFIINQMKDRDTINI